MSKFFDHVKEYDPELYDVVSNLADLAMAPGALDSKTKVLITLALDALAGAKKGVENLAKQARKLGATDQEIAEVLRLAYFVAGNKVLVISEEAFDDDDDDDDDYDDDDDDEDDDEDEGDEEEEDGYIEGKNEQNKSGFQDDSQDDEEIQELKGSTLMVFDEEMIDGPSYLSVNDTGKANPECSDSAKAETTEYEAGSEDEYVILEYPVTLK